MNPSTTTNCAVILAAGEGKRMKSNRPKVLSAVLFKPMLRWVMDAVLEAGVSTMCVVSGFQHTLVDSYVASAAGEDSRFRRGAPELPG